jgi:hypothetical protein
MEEIGLSTVFITYQIIFEDKSSSYLKNRMVLANTTPGVTLHLFSPGGGYLLEALSSTGTGLFRP